jgi:dipeptide/tripeptide permease
LAEKFVYKTKLLLFSLTDILRQPDCSPIKEDKIKQMKKRRREILRARKSFIELALFLIFLTVLFLVSFNNRDTRWFFATNHIEQHLISFSHEIAAKTTQSFSKVSQALFFILVEKKIQKEAIRSHKSKKYRHQTTPWQPKGRKDKTMHIAEY